ncbi:uncharacterized protein TNCV_4140221 [Trichonephila clavipes]|nr:uncharacterized protein TNCV_4140221 [Trichonephila clavipes]
MSRYGVPKSFRWGRKAGNHPSSIEVSEADCCAVGPGFKPREDMVVCKCIVLSWQGGTLNSRGAARPLVMLVVREERWEAFDLFQGNFTQNWGNTEPNRYVTCMVLKYTANDNRHLARYHDEFRGP